MKNRTLLSLLLATSFFLTAHSNAAQIDGSTRVLADEYANKKQYDCYDEGDQFGRRLANFYKQVSKQTASALKKSSLLRETSGFERPKLSTRCLKKYSTYMSGVNFGFFQSTNNARHNEAKCFRLLKDVTYAEADYFRRALYKPSSNGADRRNQYDRLQRKLKQFSEVCGKYEMTQPIVSGINEDVTTLHQHLSIRR